MARWLRGTLVSSFPGQQQAIAGNLPGTGSMRVVQSLRYEPKDGSRDTAGGCSSLVAASERATKTQARCE